MREIAVQHVEGENAPVRSTFVTKNESCFRIEEFADKPGRADAIDLWTRASEPDSAAKISGLELRLRFRAGLSLFQFPQDHLHIFCFGTIKKIGPSDFAKLLSNAIKFAAQI